MSIKKSDNEFIDLVYTIRNKRVMLDQDLAKMYDVETRILNQQVKRNIEKFPETFRFQLTKEEFKDFKDNLTSQNVISSWGGRRYTPYAFTEKGVLMLANVLPVIYHDIFDTFLTSLGNPWISRPPRGRLTVDSVA